MTYSKSFAQALIAQLRPVLQTGAALAETRSLSNSSMPGQLEAMAKEFKSDTDHHEFAVHEGEKFPEVRWRFNHKRLVMTLAKIFVASALVIFYLGMPADYAILKRANGTVPKAGDMRF